MHGARRVIIFCLLTAVLPTILLIIPLYLRHSLFADVIYSVSESDVLEAVDGISTVFCQEQILKMNTTFRAFQLEQMPPLSNKKKHIPLQKSMILPDDTLEYWGFFLLAGSKVQVSACSRYYGAGIIAVQGGKHLDTCGLMDLTEHKKTSKKPNEAVKVFNSQKKIFSSPQFQDKGTLNEDLQAFKRDVKELIVNYSHNNNSKTKRQNNRKVRHVKRKLRLLRGVNANKSSSLLIQNVDYTERKSNGSQKDVKDRLMKLLQGSEVNISENNGGEETDEEDRIPHRFKRNEIYATGHMLDAGIGHGGNANITENPDGESSVSSFEISLKECYENQLISETIEPSPFCSGPHSLNVSHNMKPLHISSNGYYYFIFFSDNDKFPNPIHVHFNIYKTSYQSTNYTQGCINQTECRFPISFWSNEIVIAEVPTHDGIKNEDDILFLVSSCYPRMAVYVIFPIAVLFLILGCAFL